jgi:hypothetical protein
MVSLSKATHLKFPVVSLRRIPSKTDTDGLKTYIAVVSVFDVPNLDQWRSINIRDAKLTGSVPAAIRKTLDENPGMFLFENRGLVVTAKDVKYDNESNVMTLTFEDSDIHGLLDGGHTYKVMQAYCSEVDREEIQSSDQAFVRMEILEGFTPEQIRDIVDARNTSNQVKDQSLMELGKYFIGIKSAIAGEAYADKIAYKEYEIMEGASEDKQIPKPIDIREIVALLTVFDKEHYGDNNHPIVAYSQKATCLNRFKDYPESYKKIYPLLKDILKLWDVIHRDMRKWYVGSKEKQGAGAKFGKITGINPKRPTELYFVAEVAPDLIPSSFKYPILAALRAFVVEKDGRYKWGLDPKVSLENGLGEQLTEVVIANALELRNPNKLGKTSSVWDQCYSKAQVWYLKKQAAKFK